MAKNWDAVRTYIEEYSVVQKRPLKEVITLMQRKHSFRASTRAYRLKYKEWGFLRHKPHRSRRSRLAATRIEAHDEDLSEGTSIGHSPRGGEDPTVDSLLCAALQIDEERSERGSPSTNSLQSFDTYQTKTSSPSDPGAVGVSSSRSEDQIVYSILYAGLKVGEELPAQEFTSSSGEHLARSVRHPVANNAQGQAILGLLEAVCLGNTFGIENQLQRSESRTCLNYPLGGVFESKDPRISSRWGWKSDRLDSLQGSVIFQHDFLPYEKQTLLDVASALPNTAIVRKLIQKGAKTSVHSQGVQVSMSNAIRNGRTGNVEALLASGACKARGLPGCTMVPIRQAAFWLSPSIMQLLLKYGADVNPCIDAGPHRTALQLALGRRLLDFKQENIRSEAGKTVKVLLDAGASILHEVEGKSTFEMFLDPWESDPFWGSHIDPLELSLLENFITKGADLQTPFAPVRCTSPASNTLSHQLLYHTPPRITRLLADHANLYPPGNGVYVLHEIVGSCPDVKRHPVDTLRDIEVLLARGADPNHIDQTGRTALTACLDLCPSIDVFDRVRLLLRGGADPGMLDGKGSDPVLLAVKEFEDPLRFKLTEVLLDAYSSGTGPARGERSWLEAHLNISGKLSGAVMGAYRLDHMPRNVPSEVESVINRAAFSVSTRRFLDKAVQRVPGQHADIMRIVKLREEAGLPKYEFGHNFVLELLAATMPASVIPQGWNF